MGLNLVLLLLVSLLPFTTALTAIHLQSSAGERVAVVIFGLNLLLASVMVNVAFRYAEDSSVLADQSADQQLTAFARQRRTSITFQAAATCIALLAPYPAAGLYLVISLLMLTDPVMRARRRVR
jgi:uncharacterized membrane protein